MGGNVGVDGRDEFLAAVSIEPHVESELAQRFAVADLVDARLDIFGHSILNDVFRVGVGNHWATILLGFFAQLGHIVLCLRFVPLVFEIHLDVFFHVLHQHFVEVAGLGAGANDVKQDGARRTDGVGVVRAR